MVMVFGDHFHGAVSGGDNGVARIVRAVNFGKEVNAVGQYSWRQ